MHRIIAILSCIYHEFTSHGIFYLVTAQQANIKCASQDIQTKFCVGSISKKRPVTRIKNKKPVMSYFIMYHSQ